MKTKYNSILVLLLLTLASFTPNKNTNLMQDTKTIDGVFEGKEDYGYNFIVTHDDSERTMTFQAVNADVLSQFDLSSDALVGENFKITYQVKIRKFKDDDGFDDEEETLTIIKLEAL